MLKKVYKTAMSIDALLSQIPLSLGFEDVALAQQKNKCESRLDADIRSEVIKGVWLDVPMLAANMSSVINAEYAIKLNRLGAMGVLHRAASTPDMIAEVKKVAKECIWVASSVGIGNTQIDLACNLVEAGTNIIVLDIASGFSDAVFDMAKKIKFIYKHVKVVIGNTTNPDILEEPYVQKYADAVKCGIGQGMACSTKNTAGATEKQFTAVLKFKERSRELGIPIISDGGIREGADFVKAVAAGANSIMAGSIFAACPESAAEIEYIHDKPKKLYAGMASQYTQTRWKGGLKRGTCAEGEVRYLDVGEPVEALIEHYSGCLRSGITYGGGTNIKSFQDNVQFVRFK